MYSLVQKDMWKLLKVPRAYCLPFSSVSEKKEKLRDEAERYSE
jgi:hypothetical protein